MREIKFRVYDKHLKLIRDVAYIDFDGREVMYYIDSEYSMDIVRDFDEVEIMQYTGLKDVNDVKVYESDIISIIFFEDNVELIGNVIRFNGGFVLEVRIQYGGKNDILKRNASVVLTDADKGNCIIKVLGNIYENPELLEGKQ